MIRGIAIAALFCLRAPAVDFHNVAREAGLVHSFPNGGAQSKQYILETTGSGAAFLDYDNDGLLDVFLVSGSGGTNRLYHNLGNGMFADVTKEMGLEHGGWGQGVCAGDYDNDGLHGPFRHLLGRKRTLSQLRRATDSKTSRLSPTYNRTARATTPAARFLIMTTTAISICSSPTI